MKAITITMDVLMVVAGLGAYLIRPKIGGQMERGLRILLIGVLILGLAHLLETSLFLVLNLDVQVNEIVHRLIVGLGLALVLWGLARMRRAFEE